MKSGAGRASREEAHIKSMMYVKKTIDRVAEAEAGNATGVFILVNGPFDASFEREVLSNLEIAIHEARPCASVYDRLAGRRGLGYHLADAARIDRANAAYHLHL